MQYSEGVLQHGPIDDGDWPDSLTAHVVEPGDELHVAGYAAESDLAVHYGFSEIVFLLATGELPDRPTARAFDLALSFLAPAMVTEASIHATCLARLCGATSTGTLGVAAVALGEQARFEIERHHDLFEWLERPEGSPPAEFRSDSENECASVARLSDALARVGFSLPVELTGLTRKAALFTLLHSAGLVRPDQMELAWTLARLPVAVAEARAVTPGTLRTYPMNTPSFRYEVKP
jgi:hypothetical protein